MGFGPSFCGGKEAYVVKLSPYFSVIPMSGAIPPRPMYNIRVHVHNVSLHKLKASCALKITVFVWAVLLSISHTFTDMSRRASKC